MVQVAVEVGFSGAAAALRCMRCRVRLTCARPSATQRDPCSCCTGPLGSDPASCVPSQVPCQRWSRRRSGGTARRRCGASSGRGWRRRGQPPPPGPSSQPSAEWICPLASRGAAAYSEGPWRACRHRVRKYGVDCSAGERLTGPPSFCKHSLMCCGRKCASAAATGEFEGPEMPPQATWQGAKDERPFGAADSAVWL